MVVITLPDKTKKEFESSVTALQVAESIGPGLARVALAAKINDQLVDLSSEISQDSNLSIITGRDELGVEVIRHSTAHLLAHAVKRLYPDVQVTIGPVIEDGFYYDFYYPPGFSIENFDAIEAEMKKIVKEGIAVERFELSRDDAIKFFEEQGEKYKAEIIKDIPQSEILSLYKQGDFTDLCRGPHVPNTGLLKVFKLTKVAGAYWRGDSSNEMLQRIYGTAWGDKNDLKEYLHRIEEAKKRDHRKIAKDLDLFHLQNEAPGMVFWHPKGWALNQAIRQYMVKKYKDHGYQEINTPLMADRLLWEKSGHWEKFFNDMYTTEIDERISAVKPMSCPLHVEVFNNKSHSYRDLPLRFAEFGCCHRNELSGSLHGILRVRSFVQDDGHIFCTEEQIEPEAAAFYDMAKEVYADFGFTEMTIKLSTRPEKRVGSDELWDLAEKKLANVLDATGHPWEEQPGEGAFYGPKVEYSFKDCLGRVWQLGTLQLDFSMPERLGASYVAEDNQKKTPVMLHRAILGTLERFIGILLEHYAGKLPVWLSPVQVVVLNISEKQQKYAEKIYQSLYNYGLRVESDFRNEKIGFKIRQHTLQKVPFLLIIGDQELENNQVSVRRQNGEDLGSIQLDEFIEKIQEEIQSKK